MNTTIELATVTRNCKLASCFNSVQVKYQNSVHLSFIVVHLYKTKLNSCKFILITIKYIMFEFESLKSSNEITNK